ncbi:hypothetical protein J5N97_017787 [Dioscorea zingiberensis]|uniref:Uncharacterized protein n=1 Tax=Dioscorea zingiberensis TaxID=325984 RepID=A0A9D5CNZ7_9LILI|nr:hypothetical protein J5N97_017787 [Dioscorea zingiberensis]
MIAVMEESPSSRAVVPELSKKALHPLHQIAESPTHKLVLKQWLKEADLVLRRISLKELQLTAIRRDITFLYCSFFSLHSFLLLLLVAAHSSNSCHHSWVPCICSLACSSAIGWAVLYKTDVETHTQMMLEREKEDSVLLMKCVDELKTKGLDFDLLKEVDALRRAKSLRVGARGRTVVKRWSQRYLVSGVLIAFSCVFFALMWYLLCS